MNQKFYRNPRKPACPKHGFTWTSKQWRCPQCHGFGLCFDCTVEKIEVPFCYVCDRTPKKKKNRSNPIDDNIRELQRLADTGDLQAKHQLTMLLYRLGKPMGSILTFQDYLESKYNVKLWLSKSRNYLVIGKIIVPKEKRRTGIGTQVMQELIDYADSGKMAMALTPASIGGDFTPPKILVKFYKKFGFIPNRGRHKDFTISELMIREAKE